MEIKKQILFRPTKYDEDVLLKISERHPHIPDMAGLIREALRIWDIESTDSNSKGKRLQRIEEAVTEIKKAVIKK